MKTPRFLFLFLTLGCFSTAFAETESSILPITKLAGLPSLRLDNVRFDSRQGEIRGTARVNFGYAAPRISHVRVDALNASGKIIATGCDNLSLQSLTGHPRLPGYRTRGDAFVVHLPADLRGVKSLRIIAQSGHVSPRKP